MIRSGYRWGPPGLLLVVVAVGLAGCSGRPDVQGTVTLDGAPVDGGAIVFSPTGGNKATAAGGQIVGGKFALSGSQAPVPGSYRVDITWKKKTGRQVPTPGDKGVTMDETAEAIPAAYNTKSTLTAEVKPGANTFDFPLKSR